MILVDSEILAAAKQGILCNYDLRNITTIGYDLRTEYFVTFSNEYMTECNLEPNKTIFVGCREQVNLPSNIMANVVLRNSRIRQGLALTSPVYHPGHRTQIIFRISNISGSIIKLKLDDGIANLMLERLSTGPSELYKGAFQNEFRYIGVGGYEDTMQTLLYEIEEYIFVLMPFGEKWSNTIYDLLKKTAKKLKMEIKRADEVYGIKPVISDIAKLIKQAKIVIAVTTNGNRNVNYELGIAHAWGKPTVLMAESMGDIPFDYQHRRVILYKKENDPDWGNTLISDLAKTIEHTISDNIKIYNYFNED